MDKKKYYKFLFLIIGIYNIISGAIFIIVSVIALDIFPLFGVAIPPSMIWLQLSLLLIGVFGIGYLIVSRDIEDNHGIVLIGTISKIMFFFMTLIYFILGDVNIVILLFGGIDLVMAIFLIEFLLKIEKTI